MTKHTPCASGIYEIRNLLTGKIYIGSAMTLKSRWRLHRSNLRLGRHVNIKLQRSWDKHGEGAFAFSVLEYVPSTSLLIQREQHWIDSASPWYNIAKIAGSQLGMRHSDESRAKMSASQKARAPATQETRLKLSLTSKCPCSEETKKKISAAHIGMKCPKTPEAIANHAASMRGVPRPSMRGRKQSPEALEKRIAAIRLYHANKKQEKLQA